MNAERTQDQTEIQKLIDSIQSGLSWEERNGSTSDEETWQASESFVSQTVHAFYRRYGGDLEELFSEARLHFMKALRSHDPTKGLLGRRVRKVVWYGLLDTKRIQTKRASKLPRVHRFDVRQGKVRPDEAGTDDLGQLPARRSFDVDRFLADLSEDASVVVKMALEKPRPAVGQVRDLIESILCDLGWAYRRVREAFDEIRDVLG